MDYSKVVNRIKNSIALIVCLNEKGKSIGTGTGFIFSKENILVTCNHVIKKASSISIKFPDDDNFSTAKIAIRDEEHDLALLKIDNTTKKPLGLANPEIIKEGMPIIFAGYPLLIQYLTTHRGMLSSIAKDPTGITTYLIDGTVNSGNSGCPLMSTEGKVIGVINAKRMERADLLKKVEKMQIGALALHGVDIVELYQALINNVQLGIGYAVPAAYIPECKSDERESVIKKKTINKTKKK
jgi:S1-C subfamily serine protease